MAEKQIKQHTKSKLISFYCVLKDSTGEVLSSSFNQNVLSNGEITAQRRAPTHAFELVAEDLANLKKGERRRILIPAERAFGPYRPQLVVQVPRKRFPAERMLQPGAQVITQDDTGSPRVFYVTAISDSTITLDGNHPLAGKDLDFDIEGTSARNATLEEVETERMRTKQRAFHFEYSPSQHYH